MKVFLTGATGLLGRNLVPALADAGHDVTALVRSCDKARQLTKASLIEGDLSQPEIYGEHLAGMDAVIHAGACYAEYYQSNCPKDRLRAVNVSGTLGLLEASHAQGVRRFVYVSSAGVLETREAAPTDESAAYAGASAGPYFESKIQAERVALRFAEEHPNIDLVVLLPTAMIGPHDMSPTPTGAVFERVLAGEVKIVFPGAMNVVDARDVAAAAVAALTQGQRGGRYLLGGTRQSVREIFARVTQVVGKPAPTTSPPPTMLKLVLGARGLLARLQGKRPPLRPADISRLQRNFWFDSTAAKRDLGVDFRPLDVTLRDTARWFVQQQS